MQQDDLVEDVRIDAKDATSMHSWCKRLGCSHGVLRQAIERVGDRAEDVATYVAAYLQQPRTRTRRL